MVPENAFVLELTVGEDDIDALKHVSNVTIVKWFSRAAFKHSESLGYDAEAYHRLGAWFVVRRHEIDYHNSAKAGDRLKLYTWPSGLKKVTAERRYRLERDEGAPIAEGLTVWAYVDAETERPKRIPQAVRDTFDPAKWVAH